MAEPCAIGHRRVLRIALPIALPIALSNATVPLLGAVDTGVAGQLGLAVPLAAVGLGDVVLASVYWIFGFLRMGATGLAAPACVQGDGVEFAAILIRALAVGAMAGLVLIIVRVLVLQAAWHLAPASPDVEMLAGRYVAIRIWVRRPR